jgi:tetratricopeptide (TPR) repeat protein
MRVRPLLFFLLILFLFAPSSAQVSNLRAQAELDQGVIEYQKAQYESAAKHLKKAVQLDPGSALARMYLAKTLSEQFQPDMQTTKNLAFADQAMEEFEELLKLQPRNVEAMNGLALILMRRQKPDEARRYYQQAIAIEPNNVTAHDGMGMMDWLAAERKLVQARQKDGTQSMQSAIADPLCPSRRAEALPLLDAAIKEFTRAFTVNQDDETAATYIGVAYTWRADLECGDPKARQDDLQQIPIWSDRAQQARKRRPEQSPIFTPVKL